MALYAIKRQLNSNFVFNYPYLLWLISFMEYLCLIRSPKQNPDLVATSPYFAFLELACQDVALLSRPLLF